MSPSKPGPRSAFGPRQERSGEPEHPLTPARKQERSRLAEARREPFGTRLPPDLIKEIKVAAAVRDMDIQEIVEVALRAWLKAS